MDLSNPNAWQLLYLQSFTGEYLGALQIPIAEFDTPQFSNQVIRIKVTSSEARSNWTSAGRVNQLVNSGDVWAVASSKSIYLKEDRLIWLEPISPYFLRFALPKWLKQATVSVFGFTQ